MRLFFLEEKFTGRESHTFPKASGAGVQSENVLIPKSIGVHPSEQCN